MDENSREASKKEIWTLDLREKFSALLKNKIDEAWNRCLETQNPRGLEVDCTGGLRALLNCLADPSEQEIETEESEHCISLKMASFRSIQEKYTGSDLVMLFEVFKKGEKIPTVSKATLIQAKSARIDAVDAGQNIFFRNEDIKNQLDIINAISPADGFLLMYTKEGSFSLSASDALKILRKNSFRCDIKDVESGGDIAYKLAICQKGNVKEISPLALGCDRNPEGSVDLSAYTGALTAYAKSKGLSYGKSGSIEVISLSATIGQKPKLNQKPKSKRNSKGP